MELVETETMIEDEQGAAMKFPFIEGFYAGLRGESAQLCPYEIGRDYWAWHRGRELAVGIFQ